MAAAARALLCLTSSAAGAYAVVLRESPGIAEVRRDSTGVGLNLYKEPLAPCGEGRYCDIGGQHHAICLPKMPEGYCYAVNVATDACRGVEHGPWCVAPGSFSYFATKHPAPAVDCSAIPDGLFTVALASWREWDGSRFPEQELSGLRALYQQCNVLTAEEEVGTFQMDFCGFADTALSHYDGGKKAHQTFSDCKALRHSAGSRTPLQAGSMTGFEPAKYLAGVHTNMYGESLAACGGVPDNYCEAGGLHRAICLKKMPADYCIWVGLTGEEGHGCEQAQDTPWCVTPGSFSYYVGSHEAPAVDCNAIPDQLFTVPLESWKRSNGRQDHQQELAGLKALYRQCNTGLAKATFKKNLCDFAHAALNYDDESMSSHAPLSHCLRPGRRTFAQSVGRRLQRFARRAFSPQRGGRR